MNCPSCKKDTLRHHTHSDGQRRWVTTRCVECGWVETTSWVERRPAPRDGRGNQGAGTEPTLPPRILLVDDDLAVLDVLAEAVRGFGYQVDVAAGAAEALAPLADRTYDLLLTDLMMPDLDGWQLIAAATRKQPRLRIVMMTGCVEPEDRARAAALGVPLLRKPLSLRDLQNAIQAALAPLAPGA
jgi:CheY-like chemotaxis protein